MIANAFTCTGSYAILILYGIKRTENRSAWPEPREGRAAISCSKSFCKEEYGQFIAWASVNLPPEDFEKLPSWREVKDWPGKVVGVCDYAARARGTCAPTRLRLAEDGSPHHASPQPTNQPTNQPTIYWDEGYQYWWDLSNVVRLPEPIPCRGNVGMWSLPPSIAQSVLEQVHSLQTVAVRDLPGPQTMLPQQLKFSVDLDRCPRLTWIDKTPPLAAPAGECSERSAHDDREPGGGVLHRIAHAGRLA